MDPAVLVVILILLWVLIRALRGGQRRQPLTLGRLSGPNAKPDSPVRSPQVAAVAGATRKTETPPDLSSGVWIPPGREVEIRGHKINDGMIYLGSHLNQISGYGTEPALIVPNLQVSESPEWYKGGEIPYWPSYSNLSPQARGLYLRWLEGGRKDPAVSTGIVFLFFYGLERRLIAEREAVTNTERQLLLKELNRLLGIYLQNGSFKHYASQLRDMVRVSLLTAGMVDDLCPELECEQSAGINLTFRVMLGRHAATGKPLGPELALKWIESSLGYYPRTPAHRCHEEFVQLFRIRYRQKYGDGILLKATTAKIKVDYRPASGSFLGLTVSATVLNGIEELTDVTVPEEPIRELRALAERCTDELDRYSQFLGRKPDRRTAPEALALLPQELLREQKDERLATLVSRLTQILYGKEIATLDFKELEAIWPGIQREHYGKQDALALVESLGKLGFGIEPDIRFGAYTPSPGGKLVLFKLIAGAPNNPSPSMNMALLTLRLGAMVLAADEVNGADNEDHFVENLCSAFHLAATETQRLRAKLRWLLVSKPSTLRNKKRIDNLDLGQRATIGRFLVGVTGAGGHVSPAGVNALEKVYRLLGLEPENLYSDLQSASTSPITVQSPDSGRGGYAIPPPAKPDVHGSGRIEIDVTKVSAMRAETEQVSELLRNIFVEDDEPPTKGEIAPPVQGSILGLSSAQSAFLRILVSKPSWTRAELEPLASAHQVLLNGAIDAINEKTLDNFGEPLLEGEERIEVNSAALKELGL